MWLSVSWLFILSRLKTYRGQAQRPNLFHEAQEAEQHTYTSPKASAILARSALEFTVRWLYANDSYLTTPFDARLSSLLHETCFKEILAPGMFPEVDAIRRIGNSAAHGNRVSQNQALLTIKNLYRFLKFFCELYAKKQQVIAPFDVTLIKDDTEAEKSKQQLQQLQEQLEKERVKQQREIELLQQRIAEKDAVLLQERERIQERKTERKSKCSLEKISPLLISEQETRQLYIDLLLKESGWDNLRQGYELEFEVSGMPKSINLSGKGYVDYVLWGDNGKPLAVIEAKNAMQNVKKGRHQAELYANCLEQQYQQRPIIFYTNGFETYIWDEAFYPEREVQGFYSKDELQFLINRRDERKDLRNFTPNSNIVNRHYQIQSVQRVAECLVQTQDGALRGKARQCLLVMATGSGKTRTAAAIVDMLMKCEWAKRVLFLADRNALVTQAKNAFNEFLPHLSAIDLTKEKEDDATRLVFSTYPTIMNKIDSVKSDNRFYGVGHFDLIIIDEAHRSVYYKYGAIFKYFDSLLIGLTATPKTEIDRNTYQLFHIDDNNPTFAYELDEAVKDGYLVPYKAMSVPLKFQRDGIKYNELSTTEQQQYEETFGDPTTGEVPNEICGSALNKWLFNSDTVDKVLEHLMNHGIKIEGGDKLGKTIIFAKNHKHAAFIEERFNGHYPQYSGKFLRVIDNYESKAQDLLEKFVDKNADNDPQIAVSVDMMDTGVDAPRVVNLVFFKLVRSLSKFQQMIGRGTRLCANLFAPGEDKTHFLIFDFCQNFEFFDENPEGITSNTQKSLAQCIFEAKLEVAILIRNKNEKTTSESELAEQYINELHQSVANLDAKRFVVKKELRYVTKYKEKSPWQNLSKNDILELHRHVGHLMLPVTNDHELARRFDLLILSLQVALLANSAKDKYITRIYNTARQLQTKENIPAVKKHIQLIKNIQQDTFWEQIHPAKLEQVRTALRELIQLIDREQQPIYYTNFEDKIDNDDIVVRESVTTYSTLKPYHERVESYIRNHRNHIVIQKLNTNKPITTKEIAQLENILFDGEERGTKKDYTQHYGDKPLGEFIRNIIGLDVNAAKEAFAEFLQKGNLRADQMTFVNNIITYLTKNGTIDKGMLFEAPFTDINDQGLLGVFDDAEVHNIIKIINHINDNTIAL